MGEFARRRRIGEDNGAGRLPLPYLFPSPPPLELVFFKPARRSGEHILPVGFGVEPLPDRKRILCTLKLSESCWWQFILNILSTMFTVKR